MRLGSTLTKPVDFGFRAPLGLHRTAASSAPLLCSAHPEPLLCNAHPKLETLAMHCPPFVAVPHNDCAYSGRLQAVRSLANGSRLSQTQKMNHQKMKSQRMKSQKLMLAWRMRLHPKVVPLLTHLQLHPLACPDLSASALSMSSFSFSQLWCMFRAHDCLPCMQLPLVLGQQLAHQNQLFSTTFYHAVLRGSQMLCLNVMCRQEEECRKGSFKKPCFCSQVSQQWQWFQGQGH